MQLRTAANENLDTLHATTSPNRVAKDSQRENALRTGFSEDKFDIPAKAAVSTQNPAFNAMRIGYNKTLHTKQFLLRSARHQKKIDNSLH